MPLLLLNMSLIALLAVGDMLSFGWEFLTQSWYLALGAGLLAASIVMSILSGLIDMAMYAAVIGGFVLVVVGLVNMFLPGLLPLVAVGV